MNFLRNCRDGIMKANNRGSSLESSTDASFATDAADDASAASASYVRRAHHAGSWYSSEANDLDDQLTKFLADAEEEEEDAEDENYGDDHGGGRGGGGRRRSAAVRAVPDGIPNACIAPHAGYRYSGPTAAHSYLSLREALFKNPSLRTVVVLHPSHHIYLEGCAVSGASIVETPLGNLRVDVELRRQLLSTNKFGIMEKEADEDEHSGEMQYPYIAKIINDVGAMMDGSESGGEEHGFISRVRVLPIMVGSIKSNKEEAFGRLLSPYLSDRGVFTVVSSDFCHWGRRFGYMPQPPPKSDDNKGINEVHEYIEYLDRKGMDLIEMQRPGAFADYLREHSNTICGRHPISVWMHSLRQSPLTHEVRFVGYAQSERARSTRDHSVSYASAVCQVAMFNG